VNNLILNFFFNDLADSFALLYSIDLTNFLAVQKSLYQMDSIELLLLDELVEMEVFGN